MTKRVDITESFGLGVRKPVQSPNSATGQPCQPQQTINNSKCPFAHSWIEQIGPHVLNLNLANRVKLRGLEGNLRFLVLKPSCTLPSLGTLTKYLKKKKSNPKISLEGHQDYYKYVIYKF